MSSARPFIDHACRTTTRLEIHDPDPGARRATAPPAPPPHLYALGPPRPVVDVGRAVGRRSPRRTVVMVGARDRRLAAAADGDRLPAGVLLRRSRLRRRRAGRCRSRRSGATVAAVGSATTTRET